MNNTQRVPTSLCGATAILSAVCAASSLSAAEPSNRVLDELALCRTIQPDAARLACFDRAAAAVVSERQSGKLIVFDRERVEAERRTRFGLVDPPADAGTEAAARAAAVTTISSTVTSIAQGPAAGRWNMTLANGQVWQMLGTARIEPRKGASIRLATTVTGGIRAIIDGRAPVQVRRIR